MSNLPNSPNNGSGNGDRPAGAGRSQDATGRGAGLDLRGLGSNLPTPTQPPPRLTIADVKRKMAVMEAEESQKRRALAQGQASSTPTQAPQPSFAQAAAMQVDKPAPKRPAQAPFQWPYKEISEMRSTWCAIKIDKGPTVGSPLPLASATKWAPKVVVDGGRWGQPAIHIDMWPHPIERDQQKAAAMSRNSKNRNARVSFFPGLGAPGQKWQLETFNITTLEDAMKNEKLKALAPKRILDHVPEKDLSVVMCMVLQVNSATIQNIFETTQFIKVLGENELGKELECVRELVSLRGAHRIMIWFKERHGSVRVFKERILKHFVAAYTRRLPNLFQYYIGNKLNLDLDSPGLKHIGGGMYEAQDKTNELHFKTLVHGVRLDWISPEDFKAYHRIPTVREYHFQRGAYTQFATTISRVFIKRIPKFRLPGQAVQKKQALDQRYFDECSVWYVRMPAKNVNDDHVPPEGTKIEGERDNSAPGKAHEAGDPRFFYRGVVITVPREDLVATGADMAVMMHRPPFEPQLMVYEQLQNLSNDRLPAFRLQAAVDQEGPKRELEANDKFMASTKPEITEIREAMWRRNFRTQAQHVDVSAINDQRPRFEAYIDQCKRDRNFNESQADGMHLMQGRISTGTKWRRTIKPLGMLVGPGGAGKTTVLRANVYGLRQNGLKQLITAQANGPLDSCARDLYNYMPEHLKGTVILRVEVGSLTERQIHRHQGGTTGGKSEYTLKPNKTWEDDPIYQIELTRIFNSDSFEELQKFSAMADEYKAAYEVTAKLRSPDGNDFPLETSLEWHINALVMKDIIDKINEERLQGVTNPNPASRSTSARYCHLLNLYVTEEGNLHKDLKKEFWSEREALETRVLRQADIVLVTANFAGTKLKDLGFHPDVIHFEETAQVTIPAFFVPLTAFDSWKAVYMYGDPEQLEPIVLGNRANEVPANSKLSPLALLISKGCDYVFLEYQYRMTPAISKFPMRFFYGNKLKDTDVVKQDHPIKAAVRRVSNIFGRLSNPPRGEVESEYFVVSVMQGYSRREDNGKSLQNYANAESIAVTIERLIGEGVPGTSIVVISMYKGQKNVVYSRVQAFSNGAWNFGAWATVDSFGGREADVVLVDIVVANPIKGQSHKDASGTSIDAKGYVVDGNLTSHATDHHRLCVALTRGRYGCIVFCQEASLLKVEMMKARGKKLAVAAMIRDARERKLIFYDHDSRDTHPSALEERVRRGEAAIHEQERQARAEQYHFVEDMLKDSRWRTQRRQASSNVDVLLTDIYQAEDEDDMMEPAKVDYQDLPNYLPECDKPVGDLALTDSEDERQLEAAKQASIDQVAMESRQAAKLHAAEQRSRAE